MNKKHRNGDMMTDTTVLTLEEEKITSKSRRRKRNRKRRKNTQRESHSSFWIDRFDHKSEDGSVGRILELAKYRRAIGNFVRIITEEDIEVVFPEKDQSHLAQNQSGTRKRITIGAKISEREFDSATGLALHESHHVIHTDMGYFNVKSLPRTVLTAQEQELWNQLWASAHLKLGMVDRTENENKFWKDFVIHVTNWIEDRRIDSIGYRKAPGYRGYYQAMYNQYFRTRLIDRALKTDFATVENLESYRFRLFNLFNTNSNLSALKGLTDIFHTLQMDNIDRLHTTSDSFRLAINITDIIIDSIDPVEKKEGDGDDEGGDGESKPGGDSGFGDMSKYLPPKQDPKDRDEWDSGPQELKDTDEKDDKNDGDKSDNGMKDDFEDQNSSMGGGDNSDSDSNGDGKDSGELKDFEEEFSKKNQKKLLEQMKGQESFNSGDVEKAEIPEYIKDTLKAVEASGTRVDVAHDWSASKEVLVIERLTAQILDSKICSLGVSGGYNRYGGYTSKVLDGITFSINSEAEAGVNEGIVQGKLLAKKLQLRTEDKITKFTRQENGRIDRRLIAELGAGNTEIFSRTEVDQYNKAILRISVDGSGSMGGAKWQQTFTLLVTIIKAVDLIQGLDVVVDFRTTSEKYPVVVVAYDSRVDEFSKVRRMFPLFHPMSVTPEGLCYEPIIKEMVDGSSKMDSFFLNLSDGAPYFGNYVGEPAYTHTQKQVNKMRKKGITILSYFIGGGSVSDPFRKMYGRDAEAINVSAVREIAKTMNKMFMSKAGTRGG